MRIIAQWFKDHPRGILQLTISREYFIVDLIDIIDGTAKILNSSTKKDPQSAIIDLEIKLRPPTVRVPKY